MVFLMKRKNEYMTDDEYIVFQYMFELRKKKMNMIEKVKLMDKTENITRVLDEYYDGL